MQQQSSTNSSSSNSTIAARWVLSSHGRWIPEATTRHDNQIVSMSSTSSGGDDHTQVHTPSEAKELLQDHFSLAYSSSFIHDFVDGFLNSLRPRQRRVAFSSQVASSELQSLDGPHWSDPPPPRTHLNPSCGSR